MLRVMDEQRKAEEERLQKAIEMAEKERAEEQKRKEEEEQQRLEVSKKICYNNLVNCVYFCLLGIRLIFHA